MNRVGKSMIFCYNTKIMLMQKPLKADHHSPKRSSLRITLFLDVFFLLTITVIATAVGGFFLAQSELSLRAVSELQQTVQSRQELLSTTIMKQREQISALGQSDAPLSNSLKKSIGFQAVFHLDREGRVLETKTITDDKEAVIPWAILRNLRTQNQPFFIPIFEKNRWVSYVITAPKMQNGEWMGMMVALFPAQPLSSRIFSSIHAVTSKEVLLILRDAQGDMMVLSGDGRGAGVRVYVDPASKSGVFLQGAQKKVEGYGHGTDYAGINILAAYKTIPSIGWTIMATVDRYTISSAMFRLAVNIVAIGLAFVGLLSLSTFALARRITEPLEQLSDKLDGLESRHWHYERSIYTGNELESVDQAGYDLTKRLRMAHDHLEDMVRERTEQVRKKLSENDAILESIDYGIFVTNERGGVVYSNKAGEKLIGRSISDDAEPTAMELLPLVNKDGAMIAPQDHPITVVLREGTQSVSAVDPEYSIRIEGTGDIPVQVRVTPILRGKKCVGVVAVLRNTTEERRIDKIKSEFISLVSHQLRTPLSSMRWYLEMLATKDAGPLTADQEEYVREASTSNARMVHLVNGLLNVSRLEMGKMEKRTETLNVEKIVKETADTFTLELKQKNIELAIVSTDINDLPIKTDRGLLQLIIENFLSNAIKYSKENTTISLKMIGNIKQKSVTISVTDTGIGIPVEQRESIGRRLFRGTNARLENTDGNGLGLYISTIAAGAIGATLTFESKENQGSTFILHLPSIVVTENDVADVSTLHGDAKEIVTILNTEKNGGKCSSV